MPNTDTHKQEYVWKITAAGIATKHTDDTLSKE